MYDLNESFHFAFIASSAYNCPPGEEDDDVFEISFVYSSKGALRLWMEYLRIELD